MTEDQNSSLSASYCVSKKVINAIIGVFYKSNKTLYVKRSSNMENYPGVWSLFSIQFAPNETSDFLDLESVQPLMNQMSEQRLGNVPIKILQYISSTTCVENPINYIVKLHLYRIDLLGKLVLNSNYYTDSEWMTPEEYVKRRGDALCGSCIRMWSDFCLKNGLSDIRFAPMVENDD